MNFNRLGQLIKDRHLRKADIIAQSGISKATLDNVLKGMDAKVSTVEAIARVVDVSPAVLFDDDGVEEQITSGDVSTKFLDNKMTIKEKILTFFECAGHKKD